VVVVVDSENGLLVPNSNSVLQLTSQARRKHLVLTCWWRCCCCCCCCCCFFSRLFARNANTDETSLR